MTRPSICVLMIGLAVGAYAQDKKRDPDQIGNRDVGKGVNFYSIEKEMALGKQLAEEVRRQSKILDDPITSEYINRVGQNLVRNSDATVPFTFQVIEGDQLNAFALPGGYVFVYTGLIEATETEAELASAMAHEIAHVAARHLTRQASREKIADYASLPMIVLGGGAGAAARQASRLLVPMTFLKFTREFEAEADMLGLQYAYKAGYDPAAWIDLFERMLALEKRNPSAVSKLLNTHPMAADRIRKTQQNIAEMLTDRPEFIVTTSEFNEVRERVMSRYVHKKVDEPNRPTLRKSPSATEPVPDPDEKPTIKRRDLVD